MKKLLGILFVFSLSCVYSQIFDFPHRIYTLETKYLKILYTMKSKDSAALLFREGDKIFEKCAILTGYQNTKNTKKIPVILTADEKILNGYYTPYPRTRIIINDTIPGNSELLVFNDTILGVFTHELVHALGAESRDSFFKFLSLVFGDYVVPAYGLNLPLFLVEGLAVYGESSVLNDLYGFPQGRLNNSAYISKLKQAKSLGKFPSWQEISGAGKQYYDGSLPYEFGAGFVEFLSEKFGEEKITNLLENSSSLNLMFTNGVFKKTFGLLIDEMWDKFSESIGPGEPVQYDSGENTSFEETGKTRDLNITASCCFYDNENDYGRAVFFDSVSSNVFSYEFTAKEENNGTASRVPFGKEAESLFKFRAYSVKLSFSPDGKYLAVSGCLRLGTGNEWVTKIFSLERNKFLDMEIPDSLETAFLSHNSLHENGEYKLVSLTALVSEYPALNFYNVKPDGQQSLIDKIQTLSLVLPGKVKLQPSYITPLKTGEIVFIGHKGSKAGLFVLRDNSLKEIFPGADPVTGETKFRPLSISSSVLPGGKEILSLGFDSGKGGTQPGVLNWDDKTFLLSRETLPGGINLPLITGDRLFFTSIFTRERFFSSCVFTEKNMDDFVAFNISSGTESLLSGDLQKQQTGFPIEGSGIYTGFSAFYPAFILPGLYLGPFSSGENKNPWYSVLTPGIHYHAAHLGDYWTLGVFAAYNPYYNFPVFDSEFNLGFRNFPLGINLVHNLTGGTGRTGQKELSVSLKLPYSFNIFTSKGSAGIINLQFFNSNVFLSEEFTLEKSPVYSSGINTGTDTGELFLLPFEHARYILGGKTGFDTTTRVGTGKYQFRGFNLELVGDIKLKHKPGNGIKGFVNSQEMMFSYRHPGLLRWLPVNKTSGVISFNLPFVFSVYGGFTTGVFSPLDRESYFYHSYGNNFPLDKTAGNYYGNFLLGGRLFTSLVNFNINKALGLLYFHDFDLTAAYKGLWFSGIENHGTGYFQYVDFNLNGGVSPVIGALTSVKFDFNFSARLIPETLKWYFSFFYVYNF